MLFDIAIVLLLVLINGLFAMSELALVSSRPARLEAMANAGRRGARTALVLLESPTTFLSTVQVGITSVGILSGAFSGIALGRDAADMLAQAWPAIAPYADPIAIGTIVIVITYATLVVGELVPKRLALRQPEAIAAVVAPPMRGLSRAAAPIVWLLTRSTESLVRLFGGAGGENDGVTEEEVRTLIAEGTRSGVFLAAERQMIEGVFRLGDRRVTAIMTPRPEIVWLDEHATHEELAAALSEHRISRLPICRGSIDHPVGIIHVRDLAPALLRGESVRLADYASPALVVPETLRVVSLLEQFRSERSHIAVVIDEYGATEGIVTIADILEAITGTLAEDEDDLPEIVRRSDGSWLVDGAMAIDEFEDRVRIKGLRGSGEFDTVAGLALDRLERLPSVGDSFYLPVGRFEIVDVDHHRIDKLLFVPAADDGAQADGRLDAPPPDGAD